ncbi:hypothetical protein GGI43DRAFT_230963 [Trichoderma evansii]
MMMMRCCLRCSASAGVCVACCRVTLQPVVSAIRRASTASHVALRKRLLAISNSTPPFPGFSARQLQRPSSHPFSDRLKSWNSVAHRDFQQQIRYLSPIHGQVTAGLPRPSPTSPPGTAYSGVFPASFLDRVRVVSSLIAEGKLAEIPKVYKGCKLAFASLFVSLSSSSIHPLFETRVLLQHCTTANHTNSSICTSFCFSPSPFHLFSLLIAFRQLTGRFLPINRHP